MMSTQATLGADTAGLAPASSTSSGFWRAHRRRIAKSLIGLALAVPAVWSGVRALVLIRSTDANVVADSVTLRTPIAGTLRLSSLTVGDQVQSGRIVGKVENDRVDSSRRAELEGRLRALDAEMTGVQNTIEQLDAFLAVLQSRGGTHGSFLKKHVTAQIALATSRLKAAEAIASEAASKLERAKELSAGGVTSGELLAERTRDQAVATAEVESARRTLDSLGVEQASIAAGFTLDGYSDRPYSAQRVDEIRLSLVRLRASASEQTKRREGLSIELREEEQRLARLQRATVEVPRVGRVLRLLSSNGEYVTAGQPVVELIECSKLSVAARLSDRNYARVRTGMRARFKPLGRSESFEGVVSQKVGVVDPLLKTLGVIVKLPALGAGLGSMCEVGMPGEVTFDD